MSPTRRDPRSWTEPRLLAAGFVACAVLAAAPGFGQRGASPDNAVTVYAYTLKHQPASEALEPVRMLLSASGTVEIQPGGNTLVVRDQRRAVAQVARFLQRFDHPPEDVRLDIQVLRAGPRRSRISPPEQLDVPLPDAELPADLVERLRGLFRYESYELLAKAAVTSQEGEEVTYDLGNSYSVRFQLGTVLDDQRVKLRGFKVVKNVNNPANKARHLEPRELVHTHLNLWMGRLFTLVLTEASPDQDALMVAISVRREGAGPKEE